MKFRAWDLKGNKYIDPYDILFFSGLYYQVHFSDHTFIATCPNHNRYHWPKFENFKLDCLCSELVGNVHENLNLLQ